MKRTIKTIVILTICSITAYLFSSCEKETKYTGVVKCYYSVDGFTIGKPVDSCHLVIGDETFAEFARRDDFTNVQGIYTSEFKYEALLNVAASREVIELDSIFNPIDTSYFVFEIPHYFTGKGQIRLLPNQTAETIIRLVETPQ
ncbi:MAG: hypothetical protein LBU51_05560 [Bacteroidales bacterium]|nr:hypothetical protein [Bacteroidales bacterium]